MTETDKLYYKEMLIRNRLLPFIRSGKLIAFISFYITNEPEKYIYRNNPWSVEKDEPETGKFAVIDQLWSNKEAHKYSFEIWNNLVEFIKNYYPLATNIRWNRWKNDKLYKFNVEIKKEMR